MGVRMGAESSKVGIVNNKIEIMGVVNERSN